MSFFRSAGSPFATLIAAALLALTAAVPGFATELARAAVATNAENAPALVTVPATSAAATPDATIPQSLPLKPAIVWAPANPVVQPLPQPDSVDAEDTASFASLAAAVAAQHANDTDRELECLAVGVYFESKGEPLAGQLAVAETILNRTRSGRFPKSVCGVLTQRGQFSFIRGGVVPNAEGRAGWKTAVAVAKVAQRDLWADVAPKALFFHASYVSPGWRAARVARIGNHIFYR